MAWILTALLCTAVLTGCDPGDKSPTTTSSDNRNNVATRTQDKAKKPTEPAYSLPVDSSLFSKFRNAIQTATERMAVEKNLSYAKSYVFSLEMPAALLADSSDNVERYLALHLAESKANGWDYSTLAGENLAGSVMVYAGVGTSAVYVCLCDPNGNIAGLWEDALAVPTDPDKALVHWSILPILD